jgi:hypothetical protein
MTLCAPWLTTAQLGDCGCTETPNPTVLTESILAASEVLYQLSGRQYPGICEGQVRPCGDPCRCFFDDCGCNRLAKAFLRWDVLTVTEVDIAGVILESDAYRLEGGFLVRLDGGTWPCCQNLGAAPGEEDTFTVTVTYGAVPSQIGLEAAKVLASELVRSCTPGETCALPSRVTSITRQGVSMVMLDPMNFLDNGRTGLYAVDLFLSTVNPGGVRRPSSAWSPDLPTSRTFPISNVS